MSEQSTIYDVAEQAGVSVSTVSRVINRSRRVAPDTRRRVAEVISRLDFRPNQAARGLAVRRMRNAGAPGSTPADLQYEGPWPSEERAAVTRAILQRELRSTAGEQEGAWERRTVRWLCHLALVEGVKIYAAVRVQDASEMFMATSSSGLIHRLSHSC